MIYKEEDHSLSIRFPNAINNGADENTIVNASLFSAYFRIARIYTNPNKKLILYSKLEPNTGQGSTNVGQGSPIITGKTIVYTEKFVDAYNQYSELNLNIPSGILCNLEDGDFSIDMIIGDQIFVYRNIDRLTTIQEKYLGIDMPHIPQKIVVNQCYKNQIFDFYNSNSESYILIKERYNDNFSSPDYKTGLHENDYAVNKINFPSNNNNDSCGIYEKSYVSTRMLDENEINAYIGDDHKKTYKFTVCINSTHADKKYMLSMQYASNVQAVLSFFKNGDVTKMKKDDVILHPTNGEFIDFASVIETDDLIEGDVIFVICSFPDEFGNFVSTRLESTVVFDSSMVKPYNQFYPYKDNDGSVENNEIYNLKIIDFWLYSLKDLNVQIDNFSKSTRPGVSNEKKFVRYALVWSEEVLNQYESGENNRSYLKIMYDPLKVGRFLGLRDAFLDTKRYANLNSNLGREAERGFNHFIAPRRASLLIWNQMVDENATSIPATSAILRIKRVDQSTPAICLLELTTGS